MNALCVRKETAQAILERLFLLGAVDKDYKIRGEGEWVEIPLLHPLDNYNLGILRATGAEQVNLDNFTHRMRPPIPFSAIKTKLSSCIPADLLPLLPDKWELLGDVLIVKLHSRLREYETDIADVYAKHLRARTVLCEVDSISGVYRIPRMRFLLGENAETIHNENGVKFKLDASKVMFSSGNMDERIRMARISNAHETVVDMFGGIGYFTIPMAVHSRPEKIYTCEINEVAYQYLCENVRLNRVEKHIVPLFGDCRENAPDRVADRLIMGHFESYAFLPKAMNVIKETGGIIHYHEICPIDHLDRPVLRVKDAAKLRGMDCRVLKFTDVKSFAPCVNHVVVDADIRPRA